MAPHTKYLGHSAAKTLFNSPDPMRKRMTQGMLERQLAGPEGLNWGDDAHGVLTALRENPGAVKSAVNAYAPDYDKKRGPVEVRALWTDYANVVSGLNQDEQEAYKNAIQSAPAGVTYDQMLEKINHAQYKINDPTGTFSDEDKQAAQRDIRLYLPIKGAIEKLDEWLVELKIKTAIEPTMTEDLRSNIRSA